MLISIRLLLFARVVWLPVIVYFTGALTHVTALLLLADPTKPWAYDIRDRMTAWDGRLLIQIAHYGYPGSLTYDATGNLTGNNLAFLPLYPTLTRVIHYSTGLGYSASALVLSQLSFMTFLVVVNCLIRILYCHRVAGISLIILACAQPMGIAYYMAYTESLFVALAMGAILALYRRYWTLSGLLASLAGLTRPEGVAVTLAVTVSCIIYCVRLRGIESRPVIAAWTSCLGLPTYLIWVGARVGMLNAWFTIQKAGWGTQWDNGRSLVHLYSDAFTQSGGWVMVSTVVLMTVISVITFNTCPTMPIPLALYGVSIIVMTIGQSNYYHSKLRLLISVVVFAIPIARALCSSNKSTLVSSLILGTIFSSWYGAYMLTVWHYAI